jgi:hypothetical protein
VSSAEEARQEEALLAGDAVQRLDDASSQATSIEEGAHHLRCREGPTRSLGRERPWRR